MPNKKESINEFIFFLDFFFFSGKRKPTFLLHIKYAKTTYLGYFILLKNKLYYLTKSCQIKALFREFPKNLFRKLHKKNSNTFRITIC